MPELVHYAVADAVATITLDSPHNRNALSRQLVSELFAGLEQAAADPDGEGRADHLDRAGLLLGRRPVRGLDGRAWTRAPARSSRSSG